MVKGERMKREEIEIFIKKYGRKVKLLKRGNFVLFGSIDELYDDALLFATNQESSILSYEIIEEIRTNHNRRRDKF